MLSTISKCVCSKLPCEAIFNHDQNKPVFVRSEWGINLTFLSNSFPLFTASCCKFCKFLLLFISFWRCCFLLSFASSCYKNKNKIQQKNKHTHTVSWQTCKLGMRAFIFGCRCMRSYQIQRLSSRMVGPNNYICYVSVNSKPIHPLLHH